MKLRTIAMGMGGILLAASCTNDVVEEVNMGQEISFTTRMTRANAIDNVSALKQFRVFAKAENYTETMFINGEVAKQGVISSDEDNRYIFNMEHTYHWPTGSNSIEFWAYAPTDPNKASETEIPGGNGATAKITASGAPVIENFTPTSFTSVKNNNGSIAHHNSGASHEDLLLAYQEAHRSGGTSISLNFEHALSQIEVRAKKGGTQDETGNTYNVMVKGAWIVNARGTGNVTFDENEGNKLSWSTDGSTKVVYGYELTEPISLDHTNSRLLAHNSNSELMLIPQELDEWNLETDKEQNTANGAYILILCRVEAVHPGAQHPGGGDYVTTLGTDKHVHQMFPLKDNETTFNENLYGYVCVPISTEWLPGKKYIYTLEFCGQESGAGIYPPEDDMTDLGLPTGGDGKEYITVIPTDPTDQKKPGDPVLTNPIKFSVSVKDWDEAWKDGNEGNIPMK